MDPRFELFYKVLGILTPDIISRLTTISMGEHRSSLTTLILVEEGISSPKEEEKVLKREEIMSTKKALETDEKPISEQLEQIERGPLEALTLTILDVKKKLKKSQKKLKTSEVFGMYKSNALVDINQERKNRSDMNKSSNLGVLINKKQA